jgi:transcriptional antiterminator RfaH
VDSWYLLTCKPRQEERAHTNLKGQGIESFFPKLTTQKILNGRKSIKQSALFPNYLFVRLESQNGHFSAVKNTRGVNGFVSYGATYQQVPDQLVAILKSERVNCIESFLPKTGDTVCVNNTSFNNVSAIYKQPDGDMRSVLLINLLNQQIEVSVDNKDIA